MLARLCTLATQGVSGQSTSRDDCISGTLPSFVLLFDKNSPHGYFATHRLCAWHKVAWKDQFTHCSSQMKAGPSGQASNEAPVVVSPLHRVGCRLVCLKGSDQQPLTSVVHLHRSLGCLDPQCVLCEHNPHRRCNVNFAPKYLVNDTLKAKCDAPIRIEVIDRSTGVPLGEDIPDLHLEVCFSTSKVDTSMTAICCTILTMP